MSPHDEDTANDAPVSLNLVPQEVLKTEEFAADSSAMPLFAVPKDRVLVNAIDHIKAYEKAGLTPLRRRGVYKAADVESLRNWLAAHGKSAPIFAAGLESLGDNWRMPKLSLVAIANYSADGAKPAWHDFRGEYNFPVSDPWAKWGKIHEQWITQEAFANLIDNHIHELTMVREGEELSEAVTRFLEVAATENRVNRAATPSELFQLSRSLEIYSDVKFESKINQATGERMLVHSVEQKGAGGQPLVIPAMFYIRIPVFFGERASLIGVRLRTRAPGGSVSFQCSLFAPELIVRDSFMNIAHDLGDEHSVYLGSPDYQPERC